MPEKCTAKQSFAVFLLSALLLLSSGLWCEAHKVKMFASAEGNVITGYVYFTTGGKPKNATVLVQDHAGNLLAEITANEQGEFSYTAEAQQDYVFVLNLADGHRASFTVKAEELSTALPAPAPEPAPASQTKRATETPKHIPGNSTNPQISFEEFEKIVDKAVAKQIRPLREQLDQYEAKVRLHDILGGIGYIIGLMGFGYFLRARKK
ncbi:MAG: hypothetical protein RBT80_28430 [Candidatus Vecturithrix sp.]|jgi:nickel transport protein|nr:hypothetical protein [Candidatus Vecturithrix sp.]